MREIVLFLNDFDEVAKVEINKALESGCAVKVVADCIGHTRAEMVERWANNYLKSIGAVVHREDEFGKYYKL